MREGRGVSAVDLGGGGVRGRRGGLWSFWEGRKEEGQKVWRLGKGGCIGLGGFVASVHQVSWSRLVASQCR